MTWASESGRIGIAFWDYLGARLGIPDHPVIPYLPVAVVNFATAPRTAIFE
jgi:hypothetical protein